MKKIPLAGIAVVLIVTITNAVKAQHTGIPTEPNAGNALVNIEKINVQEEAVVSVININAKAMKDFNRSCKNATNIKWSVFNNGASQVYFINDGIKTTLFYTSSGSREGMLRYYGEKKLPSRVRNAIKSKYQHFSIFQTVEVTIGNTIAWYVTIQDETSWKMIRIMDHEMTLVKELQKT